MFVDEIREYCLSLKGTSEAFPFDEQTLVFKVMGKIFALIDIFEAKSINLKCEPEYAITLRTEYSEVQPGYHMNKKHWNTVSLNGNLPHDFIKELIVHSYEQVVKGLKKAEKEALSQL